MPQDKARKNEEEEDMGMNNFPSLSFYSSLRFGLVAPLFELGASIIGGWLMMKNDFGLKPFTVHTRNKRCFPLYTHTCVCLSSALSLPPSMLLARPWRFFFLFSGHFGQTAITSAPVLHNGRAFVSSTRFVLCLLEAAKDIKPMRS
jgi:hypothetical protein